MKLLVDSIRKRFNCPTREYSYNTAYTIVQYKSYSYGFFPATLIFELAGELAVAGEDLDCHGEVIVTDVTELPENMDNGRPYFTDRGSYVLLTLQSIQVVHR